MVVNSSAKPWDGYVFESNDQSEERHASIAGFACLSLQYWFLRVSCVELKLSCRASRVFHSPDPTPAFYQIFHMMELQGLGMEDAAKALVVSKAVRRAMKEEGFSAVEAIDDLTSKLSVANLLVSTSPATTTEKALEKIVVPLRSPSRRAAPATTIAPSSQQLHRKPSARKTALKKQAKPSILSLKNPRKRLLSDDQKDNTKNGRARTDSVTEEVNAKIAETRSAKQSVKRKEVTGSAITGPVPAMKRPKL